MTTTEQRIEEITALWEHVFGDGPGLLQIWTGKRDGDDIPKETINLKNFNYPGAARTAAEWAINKATRGREVYYCAHLLTGPERSEDNAAEIAALYCELDGAPVPNGSLAPTAVVESSPGHYHCYWRLTDATPPKVARGLNYRLVHAIGADPSSFKMTQLLRVPGTGNHKYPECPAVRLVEITDAAYTPRELDELLPEYDGDGDGDEEGVAEDEPPVVLSPEALRVWRGEEPKYRDGEIDTSATLVKIARTLFNAGANRRVVIEGLRERDEALGYRKYADRKDAEKRYAEIFEEVKSNGRQSDRKVRLIVGGRKDAEADVSDISDVFSSAYKIPRFPVEALPKACAKYVDEAAQSLRCAPELVGVPVLGALSGTIGYSCTLRIKAGWETSAAMYAVVIDDPGSKKSPAQRLALKPVEQLQAKLRKVHKQARALYEQTMRQHAVDKKLAAKNDEPAPEPPDAPTMKRVLVDDITIEALAVRLEQNPRGVLSAHDELTGFIRGLDQYKSGGKGNARQAYLKLWANASIIVDRKGSDDPVVVPNPYVTLLGAIQPSLLSELPGGRSDGFLDRFLTAYPAPRPSGYSESTVKPKTDIAYHQIIYRLWDKKPNSDKNGDLVPRRVIMETAAKELFIKEANALAAEAYAAGFPAILRGPWAKMDTHLARLALIIAVTRSAEEEADGNAAWEIVTEADMRNALALLDYFKASARKVYGQLYEASSDDVLASDLRNFLSRTGCVFFGTVSELMGQLDSRALPAKSQGMGRALKRISRTAPDITLQKPPRGDERRIILRLEKTSETSETSGEGDA